MLCLREPSLGPCFGQKGGATGGGHAQVAPMEDINLHFTGDFHAITAAHNLLAAMLDNHIHWGNALDIDVRRIVWRRVLDMNDRALRDIVQSLGGPANGFPRESGFDITVASEVMAIFCLAEDLEDMEERLGRIVVAYTRDKRPVTARDLKADGAMAVLLAEAIKPNLVQTLEGTPAFVHGGPFANIAHGCNSVIATRAGLALGDYVVTEAGFGADLGAEKFFDIKCRQAGLAPAAVVIVATVRALKMNGGVAKADLAREDVEAVRRGAVNLVRHIENVRQFGVPVVVAINHFVTDSDAEIAAVQHSAAVQGAPAILCRHWAEGGAGATELAEAVVGARRCRQRGVRADLRRCAAAVRQDRGRRDEDLSRGVGDRLARDPGAAEGLGGGGLRPPAGVHGQDAIQLLDRPDLARRAHRPRRADPRGAAGGGRGVRGGDLRRDHGDARPAPQTRRRDDPHRRSGAYRGAVLGHPRSSSRT